MTIGFVMKKYSGIGYLVGNKKPISTSPQYYVSRIVMTP
jgi:hypothetical protein